MFLELLIGKLASFYLSFQYFLADILFLVYICLKFYRAICYTKLLLDQVILINPYSWPSRAFQALAKPYFDFWSIVIPPNLTRSFGLDFASVVGLEVFVIFINLVRQILRCQLIYIANLAN